MLSVRAISLLHAVRSLAQRQGRTSGLKGLDDIRGIQVDLPLEPYCLCRGCLAKWVGYSSGAEWGSKCAGEVGRVREKTWWKLGAERAGHESLEAAGFALGKDGKVIKYLKGNFVKLDADVVGRIRGERWIPSSLLNEDL